MRFLARSASVLSLAILIAGCGSDATTACCTTGDTSVRVVNAFTTPVDVLIDGNMAIASLPAGTIGTAAAPSGSHSLVLRPVGANASAPQAITTSTGALSTIAAVRSANGSVSTTVLDDTNSVVPAGKTKVRVLHFAANAGVLQVYRTQPDFPQAVRWQFPFTYQSDPNSLSAPFYQSTVGSWEIRAWQTPADSTGWANAPVKVVIPLSSGGKATVVILDKVGGGIRAEIL